MRSDHIHEVVRILRKEIRQWPVPAIGHYVQTAYTAARLLNPYEETAAPPTPQAGVTHEHLAGQAQALTWFVTEYPVLLNVLRRATAGSGDAGIP